jgi:6-phosphogluconolactonase
VSGLAVEVLADAPAAARGAAAFIASAAREAVGARGRFTLALSGGRTPAAMLEALAGEEMPWGEVHAFQVDERVAPPGDPARNLNMLESALLAPGRLAPSRLHPMPVEDADPAQGAARYAAVLGTTAGEPPVLDLVHLGLGDDGHTASLVPGDAALTITGAEVWTTAPYRGHRRMTLTFPALDRARWRLWLLTGADKGAMLARLHAGDAGIPAGRVSRERALVFCDRDAAAAAGIER